MQEKIKRPLPGIGKENGDWASGKTQVRAHYHKEAEDIGGREFRRIKLRKAYEASERGNWWPYHDLIRADLGIALTKVKPFFTADHSPSGRQVHENVEHIEAALREYQKSHRWQKHTLPVINEERFFYDDLIKTLHQRLAVLTGSSQHMPPHLAQAWEHLQNVESLYWLSEGIRPYLIPSKLSGFAPFVHHAQTKVRPHHNKELQHKPSNPAPEEKLLVGGLPANYNAATAPSHQLIIQAEQPGQKADMFDRHQTTRPDLSLLRTQVKQAKKARPRVFSRGLKKLRPPA